MFIYLTMLGLSCSMQDLCCAMRELLLELSDSSRDVWAQSFWCLGLVAPAHLGS